MATKHGGPGNDLIVGTTGDDILYGHDGNDTIIGGAGQDWLVGGNGRDFIYGGDNIDYLFGDAGNDVLYGNAGNDVLEGGSGHDVLVGGAGRDYLKGDSGYDTFQFNIPNGWTDSPVANADHILDFNAADDWIDVPVAGNASNYFELSIGYDDGFSEALKFAQTYMGDGNYVFVTDYVDGYLFADLNSNGTVETGIILEGLTSLSDFSQYNLI
jgi:Ca2+-binding RTX toxin-like protein